MRASPTTTIAFAASLGLCAALTWPAAAQSNATATAEQLEALRDSIKPEQLYTVTGDDVYMRSGAGNSYYPFAYVNAGDVVVVTGEKFNWARTRTIGPAFDEAFGYIKQHTKDSVRFAVESNGEIGRTVGRVDLIAPKLDSDYDPALSWVWLQQIPPDRELRILDSTEIEDGTVYHVALPPEAVGWISMDYLQPADAQTIERFMTAMAPLPEVDESIAHSAEAIEIPAAPPVDQPVDKGSVAPTDDDVIIAPDEPTDASHAVTDNDEPANDDVLAREEEIEPLIDIDLEPMDEHTAERETDDQPMDDALFMDQRDTADREFAPFDTPDETLEPIAEESTAAATTAEPIDALDEGIEDVGEEVPVEAIEPVAAQSTEPSNLPTEKSSATAEADEPAQEVLAIDTPRLKFEDLEAALTALRLQPTETAEIDPLRALYEELIRQTDDRAVQRYAELRIEQLTLWELAQQRKREIEALRNRSQATKQQAETVRMTLQRGNYTAVGQLQASTIYDGDKLPLLYRLQEPTTGRTIAYVDPQQTRQRLTTMIGQLVGVTGDKSYDGGLRLNLIEPKTVELLAAAPTP